MEFVTHRTSDGAEIVILEDPTAFTASYGWFVKTGARDEAPEVAGVSHFLEHMVFKGTQRRTAEDVNRELDQLGAHSNAYTSEDSTVFYASVVPECQAAAVDLLSDLMQPLLREDDFELEKQVILEEIAMYDDQPPYGAFELAAELFFGEHPLATRVLGTSESVSDLTIGQMRAYHRQRYTKDNMVFVASGKVHVPAVLDQVAAAVEKWPLESTPLQAPSPTFHSGSQVLEREQAHQNYSVHLWPGLDCNAPDRYALRMLCSILADDSGSRLFWELIDTGRAETAALWPQMFSDCGCLVGYLCCAPADTERNEEVLRGILMDAVQQGVTHKELELARNKVISSLVLSDERPSNRLFALGQSWLNRRNYEPLDVVLGKYRDVTIDDIQTVAAKTLTQPSVSVQIAGMAQEG